MPIIFAYTVMFHYLFLFYILLRYKSDLRMNYWTE